jgi:hypothetical protein
MKKVEPKFVYDEENKKRGAIIKVKEFDFVIEDLEDYTDYKTIQERCGKKEKTFTSEQVMAEIMRTR